jgi:hypothetical protein
LLLLRLVCLSRPENKKEKADRLKAEAEAREAGKVRRADHDADKFSLGSWASAGGFARLLTAAAVGKADAGSSAQLAAGVSNQAAAVDISSGGRRVAMQHGCTVACRRHCVQQQLWGTIKLVRHHQAGAFKKGSYKLLI